MVTFSFSDKAKPSTVTYLQILDNLMTLIFFFLWGFIVLNLHFVYMTELTTKSKCLFYYNFVGMSMIYLLHALAGLWLMWLGMEEEIIADDS